MRIKKYILFLFAYLLLFSTSCQQEFALNQVPATWQITYTSTDGALVLPNSNSFGEASIVFNIYEEGKGMIAFDREVIVIDDYAFSNCNNLKSITMSNKVTSIGKGAFQNCIGLDNVILSKTIRSIKDYAFEYCTDLVNITIPESVKQIGCYAFDGCSRLVSVTIGSQVNLIGNFAFFNCENLADVIVKPDTPPVLDGDSVFDSNAIERKIYVPKKSMYTYKTTTYWDEYASAIVVDDRTDDTNSDGIKIEDIVEINGVLGIVFQVSPVVKVMSIAEGCVAWGEYGVVTEATDFSDGNSNMSIINTIYNWEAKYPAFKWCADLGNGWYLPAYSELNAIYKRKESLNAILSTDALGISQFGSCYCSSTEMSDNYVYGINFEDGSEESCSKVGSYIVRAVCVLK